MQPLPAFDTLIYGRAEILLPTAVGHGFDYLLPERLGVAAGAVVTVPFGRGESVGVVWGPSRWAGDAKKLKNIKEINEELVFSPALRKCIQWAAWYTGAPLGAVLKLALPASAQGATRLVSTATPATFPHVPLSPAQSEAAAAIKAARGFEVLLLDGVTGSGKTEVYFDAIAALLERDASAQVLVLLPEIALSVQWLSRFEARFGFQPAVWHSSITPARRRLAWQGIVSGGARVVVGARSALFLPYNALKLMIIDEEHDPSYKQEEGVMYHARDMAVVRAKEEQIPLVLVSATPSLETYQHAKTGRYRELQLPARHGGAQMPEVACVDMRHEELPTDRFLSEPLRAALKETLTCGHQALLFLNRRGFAPLVLCRACGHRFECSECSAWLVLHKPKNKPPRLQCHHCGHTKPVPDACPACAAEGKLHPCGPGVERVYEEVREAFPDARILTLASDGGTEIKEAIEAMEQREVDILIGTQMVAKGHDFGALALVGVVDADLGLTGGDLRASERTYQLLHQLSGRAGRAQVAGKVILQSYAPEHAVIKALVAGGRDAFLEAELAARKTAHMPPFTRLAAVILEGKKEAELLKTARALAGALRLPPSVAVYGLAPAPLYRLRDYYRIRFLLRAERNCNLPELLREWLASVPVSRSIRVKSDMDPVSFL